MRKMQIFVIFLILPFSFGVLGQAAEKAEAKCAGLNPNSAVYFCINSAAKESDKKVILKESEIVETLKEWNMDLEPKNAAIEKFIASASQFKSWRNAQCNAKAALALGGSGSDPLYNLCRIEIDEFRLEQLAAYKAELDSRK